MDPSSGANTTTLIEMVKNCSTQVLYELGSSMEFDNPKLFLKVLSFLSDKLDDFAYKEYRPKLDEWLNSMRVSSSLKDEILAFYKEAVDVHQGRGRQVKLALGLFYADVERYLSSQKPITHKTDYLALEKLFKLPKEMLLEIISKDVSECFVSMQQSVKKEIGERKDSSFSAELRKFYEGKNKGLNEK